MEQVGQPKGEMVAADVEVSLVEASVSPMRADASRERRGSSPQVTGEGKRHHVAGGASGTARVANQRGRIA